MIRSEALALGRFKRTPLRWETKFGRWVSETGVPRIVAALARDPDLRVTNNTVYHWIRGHAPRPERAQALVELSGGRLTLEAIYDHGRQVRKAAAPRRIPTPALGGSTGEDPIGIAAALVTGAVFWDGKRHGALLNRTHASPSPAVVFVA